MRRPHFAGFLPQREIGAWKVRTNASANQGGCRLGMWASPISGVEGDKASRGLQAEPPCGDQKLGTRPSGSGGLSVLSLRLAGRNVNAAQLAAKIPRAI